MFNCTNFIVCGNKCSYNDICHDCLMLFGKWRNRPEILNIKEEKCTICDINDISVSRPDCEHFLCIKCFKKVYIETPNDIIDNHIALNNYLEHNFYIKKCQKCYS